MTTSESDVPPSPDEIWQETPPVSGVDLTTNRPAQLSGRSTEQLTPHKVLRGLADEVAKDIEAVSGWGVNGHKKNVPVTAETLLEGSLGFVSGMVESTLKERAPLALARHPGMVRTVVQAALKKAKLVKF